MNALDRLLRKTYREFVDDSTPAGESTPAGDAACDAPGPRRDPADATGLEEPADRTATQAPDDKGLAEKPAVEDADSGPKIAVFKPDWEVDHFHWPDVCRQLTEQLGPKLDEAIQQLQLEPRQQRESRRNVFMVTSSGRGVGRTTLTLCLARRAAQQGLRAAVVDLDYRNPTLMSMLGVAAEVGMERLCQGAETAEGICINAIEDGVSLLPIVKSSSEVPWAWRDVRAALRIVAAHHDVIFLDAPPVDELEGLLTSPDASFALGAIIVQDLRGSTLHAPQELASRLQRGSVWTAGVVENFAA